MFTRVELRFVSDVDKQCCKFGVMFFILLVSTACSTENLKFM